MATKKEVYSPKQFRLREMPEDVYHILLTTQAEKKKSCNCQFSLEQTIYKIIREFRRNGDK